MSLAPQQKPKNAAPTSTPVDEVATTWNSRPQTASSATTQRRCRQGPRRSRKLPPEALPTIWNRLSRATAMAFCPTPPPMAKVRVPITPMK